jgi:chaperonin GroES
LALVCRECQQSTAAVARWAADRMGFFLLGDTHMANIRPLHDRVIVKRVKEEEKTKGGIIIPDTAKEKPIEGEVIAVGNGKILEDGSVRKLDVKVGDRILFGKYSGTEVKVDGEERLILREDDILGVLEK